MRPPSISICIPAYNAERFLPATLESIAAQSFTDWELVVTEDGSRDRTAEMVRAFAARVTQPVTYGRHEINRGLPTTRNTGIAVAQGEWIAFVDSDDLWQPDHLERLVATARLGDFDMVFAGTVPFDDVTGNQLQPCVPTEDDLQDLPVALYTGRLSVLPSSVMVRRAAFDHYGMISTDFPHANDTEYWLRILRGGGQVAYTGSATCLYRKHANAMSLRASRILTNTAQICDRYVEWSALPRSLARRRTGNLYRYAARATLQADPRSALVLAKRSLHFDPSRLQTWACLSQAYLALARSRGKQGSNNTRPPARADSAGGPQLPAPAPLSYTQTH